MKMRINRFIPIGIMVLLGLYSCYPDKIDSVTEQDTAATVFKQDAFPGNYMTFSVIDTVMHMTEDGEDDKNLSRAHDAFIIQLVRDNMSVLGYQEILNPDENNKPDLLLMVSAKSSDYYGVYWWDYWGWYPGWGYAGWGYPGYPWYPGYGYPPTVYYAYTTGSLIVEMLDTEEIDLEDRQVSIIWAGIVNGILVNNPELTRNRIETQINQCFMQSPYLEK